MRYLALAIVFGTTIVVADAISFTPLISLNFEGSMTDVQHQTFIDAADYWNSVITGYDLLYDPNGIETAHGLTITASIPYIDGPSNILGSATWTKASYYDDNPVGQPTVALYYSTLGTMEFDSADVEFLVGNNTFYSVVLHEMAHVLGIGTLWTFNTDLNNTDYNLYTDDTGEYYGPNALAQWKEEFNRPDDTFVPVELGGGPGTANGHWNENDNGVGITGIVSVDNGMDFTKELMTGWASNTFFLSRTTIGGLDDLGYTVDYSKAGIVNHTVVAPEVSSFVSCLAALPWLILRRRR